MKKTETQGVCLMLLYIIYFYFMLFIIFFGFSNLNIGISNSGPLFFFEYFQNIQRPLKTVAVYYSLLVVVS